MVKQLSGDSTAGVMVSCKIPILVIRVRFPGGATQVFYVFLPSSYIFLFYVARNYVFCAYVLTIYRRWRLTQFESKRQNKKILSTRHKLRYIPPYPLLFPIVVVNFKIIMTKWRKT